MADHVPPDPTVDVRIYTTSNDIAAAKDYADRMMKEGKDALLRDRGQAKDQKYRSDCYYSLLAELAVPRAFPDFSISPPTGHVPDKRDWNPDHSFKFGGQTYHLHTKAQTETSSRRYGTAWCFSEDDQRLSQNLETDYLCLCTVADDASAVYVRAFLPLRAITDCALFTKKGVAPRLRHSKWVVRLSMIDELGLDRFQIPGGTY